MQTIDKEMKTREREIVKTSITGIAVNAALAAFKAVTGILSNSIAITLDAVNNLSDALSSVITIIGTRLAGKPADKKHPLGYGRVENLSAVIISVIVLYAGISSFVEAVKAIIWPETPDYAPVSLIIVGVAVAAKILLGRYVSGVGKRLNSDALSASGKDALNDAIISASTLIAAVIFITTGIALEAYLGAIISVLIIKSGYEMLSETISRILGQRIEGDLSTGIKSAISEIDGVDGAYDLVLHEYGPEKLMGSVHIGVPENMTADLIDSLTRRIQHEVYCKFGVIITAVGVYAENTGDSEAALIRNDVLRIIGRHEYIMQTHGFHVDLDMRCITVDVIIDFAAPDRNAIYKSIVEEIRAAYPDYQVIVTLDSDISE